MASEITEAEIDMYYSTPGTGFTATCTVSSGGTGFTATCAVSGGSVETTTITSGGSGYSSPPQITVSGGGGIGATITAGVTSGVVTSLNIEFIGTGYTTAPTISSFSGGGVTTVTITNGGSGYLSPPFLTPTVGSNTPSSLPVFAPVVSSGVVTGVNIVSPGTNWTTAPVLTASTYSSSSALENYIGVNGLASLEAYRLSLLGPPNIGTDMNGVPLTWPLPLYPDVVSMLRSLIINQIILPAMTQFPTSGVSTAQAALEAAEASFLAAIAAELSQ